MDYYFGKPCRFLGYLASYLLSTEGNLLNNNSPLANPCPFSTPGVKPYFSSMTLVQTSWSNITKSKGGMTPDHNIFHSCKANFIKNSTEYRVLLSLCSQNQRSIRRAGFVSGWWLFVSWFSQTLCKKLTFFWPTLEFSKTLESFGTTFRRQCFYIGSTNKKW